MTLFRRNRVKRHGMLLDGPADGGRCADCAADCCRGFPSVVLTAAEYGTLARLGARRLVFTLDERFFLVIENGCEFLVGNRCGIYADRPAICRRFTCRDD
jgi:Fe-S-cluster containining protein